MTDAVPAPVLLAALATLSVDLRGAVVLDAGGEVLAGDAALTPAVQALLQDAGTAVVRQAPRPDGTLFAACSATHALAVVAGPQALEAVVAHDLLRGLTDLSPC